MSSLREVVTQAAARSPFLEDGVQQVGSRSAKAHFPSIKARGRKLPPVMQFQLLFASSWSKN